MWCFRAKNVPNINSIYDNNKINFFYLENSIFVCAFKKVSGDVNSIF